MEMFKGGNRSIQKLQFRDYKTQKPFLFSDYANAVENDWKADEVYARGGEGAPKRLCFNSNKEGTVKVSTQIYTMKEIAMLNGTDVLIDIAKIYKREELIVQEDTTATPSVFYVTLTKTPISMTGGTVGVTDVAVLEFTNGTQGVDIVVNSVTAGTKKVEIDGVIAGQVVEAWYQYTPTASRTVRIAPDKFPKYFTVAGDTFFQDENGDTVDGQIVYYKAKPKSNFNFKFANSGDPTSLEIEFDLFAHRKDGEDVMADITQYGE